MNPSFDRIGWCQKCKRVTRRQLCTRFLFFLIHLMARVPVRKQKYTTRARSCTILRAVASNFEILPELFLRVSEFRVVSSFLSVVSSFPTETEISLHWKTKVNISPFSFLPSLSLLAFLPFFTFSQSTCWTTSVCCFSVL